MIQNEPRNEEKVEGVAPEDASPIDDAETKAEAEDTEAATTGEEAPGEGEPGVEDEVRRELEETKERLLRSLADVENMRRRHARELEDARKYAITGFARELLDIADNLNRAINSVPPKARDKIDLIKNLAEGVAMTEKMLLASFERHQIQKVEPAPGEKFDHNRHQAMFEVPTDEHAPGSIAQVVQPGYVIAERLLRPAMVGVAKPVEAATTDTAGEAAADQAADGDTAEDAGGGPESRPGDRVDTTV